MPSSKKPEPEQTQETEDVQPIEEATEKEPETQTTEPSEDAPQEEYVEVEREPLGVFALETTRKKLEAILMPISVITDEPAFTVSKDGLALRQMDPSRVAMVDFEASFAGLGSGNETYTFTEKGMVSFNMTELLKIVKRAGAEDKVSIKVDPENARIIVSIGEKQNRTFSLPSMEVDKTAISPEPEVDLKTSLKTTVSALRKVVEDCALVGDHITINVDAGNIGFKTVGDLMTAESEWSKANDEVLELIENGGAVKVCLSIVYLQDMLKNAKTSAITMSLKTDMPAHLDFSDAGKLEYWVAPRIEAL